MILLLAAALTLQDLPSQSLQPHAARTDGALLTPEGKLLVTVGIPDSVARVWIADTGRQLFTLGDKARRIAMSADGTRVAVASSDGVTLWDPATGARVHTLDNSPVWAMAFAADGKSITTIRSRTVDASIVTKWDLRTGAQEASFEIPAASTSCRTNGGLLALHHRDRSIRIWDLAERKETRRLTVASSSGSPFALRPDGYGAVIAEDHAYVFWDLASGKELKRLVEGYGGDLALGYSEDGKLLALAAEAGIEVWDGAGEKRIALLGLPKTGVFQASSLTFSSDNRTLLAGGTMILRNAPKDQKTQGSLYFWKLKR